MKRLRLTSLAEEDYLQALAWYEKQQPGLGREFEIELAALFKRICRNPEIYSMKTATVRKTRMPRFKYGIYFTIADNEIGVLAIYHPSRNPQTLRRRFR